MPGPDQQAADALVVDLAVSVWTIAAGKPVDRAARC